MHQHILFEIGFATKVGGHDANSCLRSGVRIASSGAECVVFFGVFPGGYRQRSYV